MRLHYPLILFLFIYLAFLPRIAVGQDQDLYSLKIKKGYYESISQHDTIVPISFLCDTSTKGIVNLQFFEEFNYPKLVYSRNKNTVKLSNDSIDIVLTIKHFDKKSFSRNYLTDSSLYFNNIYFKAIPIEVFQKNPFYPKTVISDISININNRKVCLPIGEFKGIYNPDIAFQHYGKSLLYGVNAYVADNKKIILTIDCGEGAGASIVIFIISPNGAFEKRIWGSVI